MKRDERQKLHYGLMTESLNLTRIIQMTQPDEIDNIATQSHEQLSIDTLEYTANIDWLASISDLFRFVQLVSQSEITSY